MLKVAESTLDEVDVVLWIVEATTFIGAGERYIIEQLQHVKTPIIVVVNKIDNVEESKVFEAINTYKDACDFAEIVPVSALKGKNTDELIDTIMKYLPYAVLDIDIKDDDSYYVAFDYVVDNQDIRNKYRILKSIADKAEGKTIILDMICFEYLILAFDKLVEWTGTGKTDKIKIREEVLTAVENHRINISKIDDEKTLQYIAGFKRYSTERVMKSLVGEFTQNEKWSVKGTLMGECWYKDCCVSEHPDSLRCGKPEIESGDEKMRMLIRSEKVQRLMRDITLKE